MMSNKARALAFRDEVLIAFHEAGFCRATKPTELKRATGQARQRHGDILGIDGVTIAVRCQQELALSEAADEVRHEADAEGNDVYASVQSRRGHQVDEAYVTMPLHVLLRLLRIRELGSC